MWVDPLVQKTKLEGLNAFTTSLHVGVELLEDGFADKNNTVSFIISFFFNAFIDLFWDVFISESSIRSFKQTETDVLSILAREESASALQGLPTFCCETVYGKRREEDTRRKVISY